MSEQPPIKTHLSPQGGAVQVNSWTLIKHAIEAVILTRENVRTIHQETINMATEYRAEGQETEAQVCEAFAGAQMAYINALSALIHEHARR